MTIYESISPLEILEPYIFPISKVAVHSYEGLCYQLHQDWFESTFVFDSERMLQFIEDQIGLKEVKNHIMGMEIAPNQLEPVFRMLFEYMPIELENHDRFLEEIHTWDQLSEHEQFKYRGDRFYEMNQYAKAIKYYKEALTITYSVEVENNMSMMHLLLHDYKEAESRLKHAIEISPSSEMYHNLIQIYKQQGRLDAALELIYTIVEAYQSGPLLYEGGEICLQKRLYNEALLYFSKSYSLESSEETLYKLIETRIEARQLKTAMEQIEQVKEVNLVRYYVLKSQIYEKAKHLDVAIETIEEAMTVCGESRMFYMILSKLYRYDKQIIKAIEAVSYADNLDSTNHSEDDIVYEMALIAKQAGQYEDYYDKINQLIEVWKKEARYRLT
nr:hypothetical protein [Vallitaleaceae bacterium]